MPAEPQSPSPSDATEAASRWLARRDRGLTAAEQDAYLEWLRADPRHSAAIASLEKSWGALDALAEWRPAHSGQPNPDLLARRRPAHRWRHPMFLGALAAAAALVVAFVVFKAVRGGPTPSVRVIPSPERLSLVDGSVVELNHGGKIQTAFTAETRRVRLVRGEAHFTVAKNPARPFIVEAGGVTVRAVGTAFDVRHAEGAVEVLVTEGKVHVERPAPPSESQVPAPAPMATPLVAGERAVVDTTRPAAAPAVAVVSASDIARALAWQGVRLEFESLPLAEVVAEFNLRNRQQLVIGDAATGRLRVGGSFRADNVDAFVRLLEASFGVIAERRADGSLLLRREK